MSSTPSAPWRPPKRTGSASSVLQAQEARLEALLGVGRAADAAAAAAHLVHDHPLRESLHALQLLALYRSGRQTEALAAYQVLRERLADDLGWTRGQPCAVCTLSCCSRTRAWTSARPSPPTTHRRLVSRSPWRPFGIHRWALTCSAGSGLPARSRPCATSRRATEGSGCCLARPASERPDWRRR